MRANKILFWSLNFCTIFRKLTHFFLRELSLSLKYVKRNIYVCKKIHNMYIQNRFEMDAYFGGIDLSK